jgi:predicted secreted hydrolase
MRRRLGLGGLLALVLPPGTARWAEAAEATEARSGSAGPEGGGVQQGRTLRFPADHAAHPGSRIEWWYVTGHLHEGMPEGRPALRAAGGPSPPRWGFQLTFFRFRTGLAESLPGRFAPKQVLFAHAALTDLQPAEPAQGFRHAQRLGRWNGESLAPVAHASLTDADLALNGWRLQRQAADGSYRADFGLDPVRLELRLVPSQPLLLQGDAGYSRKGPSPAQASHYYSEPQLQVSGRLGPAGAAVAVAGTAWLDHEWSDSLIPAEAEGWDWAGINLGDGGALTVFRLRRTGGAGSVWAGGSYRSPAGQRRVFGPDEVVWQPGRRWRSPQTGADYPVEWTLDTPVGRYTLRAMLDAQELDSRGSTGSAYWEGLSALSDASGARVGLGYLEMTGYAGRLAL